MTEKNLIARGRRSLIAGIGAGAAGLAAGAAIAQTGTDRGRASGFVPARHTIDQWMDEQPGSHRVFVDSASAGGGVDALVYAHNIFAAQERAYEGTPADFAMIVCFRHFSTPFGFGDAVWEEYGEAFNAIMQFPDPASGRAPSVNLLNAQNRRDLPNRGITIDSHVARGTQFAICDTAARGFAAQAAARIDKSADEVYEDFVAGAIPNSRFVSAGVMALTRAQEYGYSLLYAG